MMAQNVFIPHIYLLKNKQLQFKIAWPRLEANSKFTSYPSTIRYWFATYPEARARLDRATNYTDIESADEKASRAMRKKKQIEDTSDENSNDCTDEESENYPRKKNKKGGAGTIINKKRKIQSPQFPTFLYLISM